MLARHARDITKSVAKCFTCQHIKSISKAPVELLQPIKSPYQVWEDVSMDFVVHLPTLNNNIVITVIVGRFSKAGHFMLHTHFSATKAAEVLTITICKLHGYHRSIISDKDTIFLSSFWRILLKLNGTKLRMSTADHPQIDG